MTKGPIESCDQAQFARDYVHAYQSSGSEFYRHITTEILDYVVREMNSPEGRFHSWQEVELEGHGGKFVVWTQEEIQYLLGGVPRGWS